MKFPLALEKEELGLIVKFESHEVVVRIPWPNSTLPPEPSEKLPAKVELINSPAATSDSAIP